MSKKLIKVAFLDRDGIINEDLNYVHKKNNFIFRDGIFKLLNILSEKKYSIIIITNQSGIARGIFTENVYKELTKYYISILNNNGIQILDVYHCPHHPNYSDPPFNNCSCRKPKPGLFINAEKNHNVDMNKSIAIGDSLRDLEAAYLSGVKKRILISKKDLNSKFITHRFNNIIECSKNILNLKTI